MYTHVAAHTRQATEFAGRLRSIGSLQDWPVGFLYQVVLRSSTGLYLRCACNALVLLV